MSETLNFLFQGKPINKKLPVSFPETANDFGRIALYLCLFKNKESFFRILGISDYFQNETRTWSLNEIVIVFLNEKIQKDLKRYNQTLMEHDWEIILSFALNSEYSKSVLDFLIENKIERFSKTKTLILGAIGALDNYFRILNLDKLPSSELEKEISTFANFLSFLNQKDQNLLETMVFKEKKPKKVLSFLRTYDWIGEKIKLVNEAKYYLENFKKPGMHDKLISSFYSSYFLEKRNNLERFDVYDVFTSGEDHTNFYATSEDTLAFVFADLFSFSEYRLKQMFLDKEIILTAIKNRKEEVLLYETSILENPRHDPKIMKIFMERFAKKREEQEYILLTDLKIERYLKIEKKYQDSNFSELQKSIRSLIETIELCFIRESNVKPERVQIQKDLLSIIEKKGTTSIINSLYLTGFLMSGLLFSASPSSLVNSINRPLPPLPREAPQVHTFATSRSLYFSESASMVEESSSIAKQEDLISIEKNMEEGMEVLQEQKEEPLIFTLAGEKEAFFEVEDLPFLETENSALLEVGKNINAFREILRSKEIHCYPVLRSYISNYDASKTEISLINSIGYFDANQSLRQKLQVVLKELAFFVYNNKDHENDHFLPVAHFSAYAVQKI